MIDKIVLSMSEDRDTTPCLQPFCRRDGESPRRWPVLVWYCVGRLP